MTETPRNKAPLRKTHPGEALDIAFRLLDATPVKRALQMTSDPITLVVSGDIYRSVVRHGYGGIDKNAFHQVVRVQIAGSDLRK